MTHWVLRPFYHYLAKNKLEQFTSDDLWGFVESRCENFRKYLESDKKHTNAIGHIFGEAVREGVVVEIGRRPSNRRSAKTRKIGIYRFTEKARGELA